jgi:hypothetical protein
MPIGILSASPLEPSLDHQLAGTLHDPAADGIALGTEGGVAEVLLPRREVAHCPSLLWSARPDLVHLDRLPAGPPEGVLGEDPRLGSSREEGDRLRALIVDHLLAMTQRLEHHTPGERSAFVAAIGAQVRFLEAVSAEMMVHRPPPLGRATYVDALHAHVTLLENALEAATGNAHRAPLGITEAYISFLLALRDGHYRQAAECADRALAALSSEHS